MLLTSVESMKKTPSSECSFPFSIRRPFPRGTSFSSIDLKCDGCVKSPVETRFMPFLFAHMEMAGSVMSLLVALEYFVWICRSAMIRIFRYRGGESLFIRSEERRVGKE